MHIDTVRLRIGLELLQILVEMSERVFLDRRRERAQLLPFGNAVHLAVSLLPQVPQPLVMHLLVLGRRNKARGGFRLIDRPVTMDLGAARLRLGPRAQRLRSRLGMIETAAVPHDCFGIERGQQLGVQHRVAFAHALAPFRIWATWMNLIGTPMRSAQPCWCIRQELSAETMYSAPARAWSVTLS